MWERGWWQRLSIGPYSSGAMPHRTDNKRRGNSLPREGLQPCVAPYFADRGVGDMRGLRRYAEKMPPRRQWQTVIAPHNDLTRNAIYATLRRMRQPRTPPGCDLGAAHRRSPHVATTLRPINQYANADGCTGPRMSPRPCDLSINTLPWTVVPTPRGEIRSSSPPRAEGRSLRCARFGGISRCCDAEHRTLLATYASNGANGANGRYGGGHFTRCEVPPSRSL